MLHGNKAYKRIKRPDLASFLAEQLNLHVLKPWLSLGCCRWKHSKLLMPGFNFSLSCIPAAITSITWLHQTLFPYKKLQLHWSSEKRMLAYQYMTIPKFLTSSAALIIRQNNVSISGWGLPDTPYMEIQKLGKWMQRIPGNEDKQSLSLQSDLRHVYITKMFGRAS